MEAVWNKVKSALQKQIAHHSFRMWIEPLELSRGKKDTWEVSCPNFFSKKRVQDQYGSMIESELHSMYRKTTANLKQRTTESNKYRCPMIICVRTAAGI
jgi:chromosomal replication initiation ATPase DnaA